MKQLIILVLAIFATNMQGNAQQAGSIYGDTYGPGLYYSPLIYGPNGFRTVEEENRLMDQTIAQLHRQRDLNEMTPEQVEAAKKKREIKQEIKNDAIEAKKQKAQAAKKK